MDKLKNLPTQDNRNSSLSIQEIEGTASPTQAIMPNAISFNDSQFPIAGGSVHQSE